MRNQAKIIFRRFNKGLGFRLLGCLGLILAQAACTTYQYVPPTTETGRQCVMTCETGHQACVGDAQYSADRRARSCEVDRSITLKKCLERASSDAEARTCNNSSSANYCGNSANTLSCDADYRRCYAGCGGQVTPDKR
ncbi:hypothetical protein SAMN05216570_1037 [Dyella sp. OK004]|uniref:hypothetical protein n=1 Tax=Dyella sp. OK004 TaxID=1855292 RepID=UPI0008EE539D|nr:hypothetical protein [Dyella sp. OK004]SFR94715.1 hypothetical protein SAMN05216570_1037 [Dyella sp. OK004]